MLETKEIAVNDWVPYSNKNYAKDLENFGWKHKEETHRRSGRISRTIEVMERDTALAGYPDLCRCEQEYERARSTFKRYDPAEPIEAVILFLLLIIPGVIYMMRKSEEKSDVELNNRRALERMRKAQEEAKAFLK